MSFPNWFLIGLLEAAGWPRVQKSLFRKKQVVAGMMINTGYRQLLQGAMLLGANRKTLSVRLVADCFPGRSDWSTDDGRILVEGLESSAWSVIAGETGMRRIATLRASNPDVPPWEMFLPENELALAFPLMGVIPVDVLSDAHFQFALHWNFCASLLYGVRYSAEVVEAVRAARERSLRKLPMALEAGLNLPEGWQPPDDHALTQQFVGSVIEYSENRGGLAAIPLSLTTHPTIRAALESDPHAVAALELSAL